MRKIEQSVQRATSFISGFLHLLGMLFLVFGVALFATPTFGPIAGAGAFISGVVLLGLGSIRAGLLDVVYELRLLRATLQDTTSIHAAPPDAERK
jgi:hypothetical protein